jgi:hypothetical protein
MSTTPVTHDFNIVDTTDYPTWPMFQMMDLYGVQVPEAPAIECEEEVAVEMYTVMARLKALDDVFYNAQVCHTHTNNVGCSDVLSEHSI